MVGFENGFDIFALNQYAASRTVCMDDGALGVAYR